MGISREQALDCLRSDDLIGLGMEADAVRRRLHPEAVVGYAIERAVSMAGGAWATGNADDALRNRLYDEIAEAIELGCTSVRLLGGLGADAKGCGIEGFEKGLRGLRQRFPALWLEALSAEEIGSLAAGCGLVLREAIARLRDAGMDSIACDSAQPQCSVEQWLAVHRAAHSLGMRTVAAVRSSARETLEQRVDFLAEVRRLQEQTGGFAAFLPCNFQPRAAASAGFDGPTAVAQMKALAIARIFLDNIENIQLSGATLGLKVLQMGLRFGANDAGTLAPQGRGAKAASGENASAANHASEEDLRRIIRDAGFHPAQRDTSYRTMFIN